MKYDFLENLYLSEEKKTHFYFYDNEKIVGFDKMNKVYLKLMRFDISVIIFYS